MAVFVFEVRFNGLLIAPSRSAYGELEGYALDLNDVKEVLEEGFDCAKSKRRKGLIERCLRRNGGSGKVLRVVVARDYNDFLRQDVWVVVHVSVHAWNKNRDKNRNEKFSEFSEQGKRGGMEK